MGEGEFFCRMRQKKRVGGKVAEANAFLGPALFVRVRELNTRGQAPAFRAKALNTRALFIFFGGGLLSAF